MRLPRVITQARRITSVSVDCKKKFDQNPGKFVKEAEAARPLPIMIPAPRPKGTTEVEPMATAWQCVLLVTALAGAAAAKERMFQGTWKTTERPLDSFCDVRDQAG